MSNTQQKSKADLIKDMQNIVEEINIKQEEVEILLKIIKDLNQNYFKIAEEINNN